MNAQSERGQRDLGDGDVNQSPLEGFPARRDLCCRCDFANGIVCA